MRYTVNTEKARQIHQRYTLMSKMWKLWMVVFGLVTIACGVCIMMAPVQTIITTCCVLVGVCALAALLSGIIYIRLKGELSVKYIEFIDNSHSEIVGMGIRPPTGSDGYEGIQEVYITVRDSNGVVDKIVLGLANVVYNHNLEASMIDITRNRIFMVA